MRQLLGVALLLATSVIADHAAHGFDYKGCFNVDAKCFNTAVNVADYTVDNCLVACKDYKFAGLYYDSCRCSDSLPAMVQIDESACDYHCQNTPSLGACGHCSSDTIANVYAANGNCETATSQNPPPSPYTTHPVGGDPPGLGDHALTPCTGGQSNPRLSTIFTTFTPTVPPSAEPTATTLFPLPPSASPLVSISCTGTADCPSGDISTTNYPTPSVSPPSSGVEPENPPAEGTPGSEPGGPPSSEPGNQPGAEPSGPYTAPIGPVGPEESDDSKTSPCTSTAFSTITSPTATPTGPGDSPNDGRGPGDPGIEAPASGEEPTIPDVPSTVAIAGAHQVEVALVGLMLTAITLVVPATLAASSF